MSLYERLGGSGAITAVVGKFYEIMLKDDRVAHYFASTNMEKQKQSQVDFITLVTGGPNNYQGIDMKAAHCKHSIGHMEFDATWENLQKALHFFNVPEKEVNELKETFYSVEGEIVNKKSETQNKTEKTLYEKLGEKAAVTLVVNKFYDIMLQDPRVSHYFANTEMQKQRNSQIEFISMVTGGPAEYTGKDMKAAHCSYKIGHLQFDATWQNLETALKVFSVPENLIQDVKEIFYSVEEEIVTQTTINSQKSTNGKCPFHKQQTLIAQNKCPKSEEKSEVKPQVQSLYERLGGSGAVSLVVNKFYDIMLQDPRVKSYFSKTDMEKQKTSQIQFITMVTGGPNNYQGKDMKTAHCPYKIGPASFNATWQNLQKAFVCFKVDSNLVNEVKEIFYSVEGEIVNSSDSNPPKQLNTQTSQETLSKECPLKVPSESYDQSELMKCPHMQMKLKQIEIYSHKLSQNEKRKLRQDVIHKEEEAKQARKLSNNPYQKTYY